MSLSKGSTPCYGCGDRQIGCHSSCEKYAEYNRENIRRRKERDDEYRFIENTIHAKRKATVEKMGKKGYSHGHKL